jgi:poly(beta-D-mannuronate) lyase
VEQVQAAAIYSDPSGSRLDTQGLVQNRQLVQPLRDFVTDLARQADDNAATPNAAALECATTMLRRWADAGAMLRQPASFPAIRERQRFALGITLAVFKLNAAGWKPDARVSAWLKSLNTAVIQDFARRRIIDNLAVWSAVNAAALALIERDPGALRYQDDIWHQALAQVAPDGSVPSELRRQSRALLYHAYYASALLLLSQIRAALGEPASAREAADMRRLVNYVESELCKPGALASAAGPQEKPPADQFAVGSIFGQGVIDERWKRCGAAPDNLRDVTLGGQLETTFELLRGRATAPGARQG